MFDPSVSYDASFYSPGKLAHRLRTLAKREGREDWRVQVAMAVDAVNETSFAFGALDAKEKRNFKPRKNHNHMKNLRVGFDNHDERRNKYADVANMRK